MSLSPEGVLLALIAGWLLAQLLIMFGLARGLPQRRAPRWRQHRLWWLAASAVALPILAPAALWLAGLLLPQDWVQGHCGGHSHDHLHACGELAHAWHAGAALHALSVVVTLIVMLLVRVLWRKARLQARLKALRALSEGAGRLRWLDDDRPLALAMNPDEPTVVLSRGMRRALGRRQLRIVLAHEAAHLRHGDSRRSDLFDLLLVFCLPPLASRLRAAWQLALEEAADDRVRERFPGHEVADTLLRVLSLGVRPVAGTQGISNAASVVRIRRLLQPLPDSAGVDLFAGCCAVVVMALPSVMLGSHHWLETVFHALLGS